jgi:hypothetical protein
VCTVGPTGSWLTGNLLAPLLIDFEVGAGVQLIRDAPLSDLRVPVDLAAFAAARGPRTGPAREPRAPETLLADPVGEPVA